jgi:hypothetical protein
VASPRWAGRSDQPGPALHGLRVRRPRAEQRPQRHGQLQCRRELREAAQCREARGQPGLGTSERVLPERTGDVRAGPRLGGEREQLRRVACGGSNQARVRSSETAIRTAGRVL